jgi:hypothetical protein
VECLLAGICTPHRKTNRSKQVGRAHWVDEVSPIPVFQQILAPGKRIEHTFQLFNLSGQFNRVRSRTLPGRVVIDRRQCGPQPVSRMRVPASAAAAASMRLCMVKSVSSRRSETPVLS